MPKSNKIGLKKESDISSFSVCVSETDFSQSELRYQSLLGSAEKISRIGAWEWNFNAGAWTFSPEWLSIHGCEKESPSFEEFLLLCYPDDRGGLSRSLKKAKRGNDKSYDFEYRIIKKDTGEIRFIKARAEIMRDGNKKPVKLLGVAKDSTEAKHQEEKIAQFNRILLARNNCNKAVLTAKNEEEYLKKICQIIINDCGHFLAWIGYSNHDKKKSVMPMASAGFEKGYIRTLNVTWANKPRGQGPTGTSIRTKKIAICQNMLIDPKFKPWKKEAVKRGYASSVSIPFISEEKAFGAITIYSKKSNAFHEKEISMLEELRNDIVFGINAIRAKVAREEAENDLKIAKEKIEVNLNEKNNFIAIMSHELRNPLAPILSGAEFIKNVLEHDFKYDKNAEKIFEPIGIIRHQAKNMSRLLDDLLDITRITRGKIQLKKEIFDLKKTIKNAHRTVLPLASTQKHKIAMSLPSQPIFIKGDPVRIEQIFTNLLNNAIKYTKSGGRISLVAKSSSKWAKIIIKDNGIGIEPEKISLIFNLFSRAATPFVTTLGELGIGLKLTKDLVDLHGGVIFPKSKGINKGSEFVVKLPVIKMRRKSRKLNKKEEESRVKKTRVIVIDDNKDTGNLLSKSLVFFGIESQSYDSPVEAIKIIEKYNPQIAFIDIGMPVMNGYDVAKEIRKKPIGKNIKLIALTGYGQEEDKKKSKEAGFDLHLVKPVDLDAIKKAITN